jgi:hypothetical protein
MDLFFNCKKKKNIYYTACTNHPLVKGVDKGLTCLLNALIQVDSN